MLKIYTPPPVVVEELLEYEVEGILNSRYYRSKLQYLVKWKGYGFEHNTWEPAENLLENANEEVLRFHSANPKKPGPALRLPKEGHMSGSKRRSPQRNVDA